MESPDVSYQTWKYSGKTIGIAFIAVVLFAGVVLYGAALVMWGIIYTSQKRSDMYDKGIKKVAAIDNKKLAHYPPIKIKKNVTIRIINGTGDSEYQREIINALVDSGYSLDNIEIENVAVLGEIGPSITSDADFEVIVANIKKVLKSIVPRISDGISNNDPNTDSEFDVVFVTGNTVTIPIIPTQVTSLP